MADLDFPSNPIIGDTYTNGETIWTWNGVKWVAQSGLALSLGYTGSQGVGYTGSRGDLGYTGSQGVGYTGSQGAGYTGSRGDLGYTGSQGVGYTGSRGLQGYTGSRGNLGYTGSRGFLGYTGSQGSQGDTGGVTYDVANDGAGAYLILSQSNPTLTLARGFTYYFNVNAPGHPFWIKTVSSTGTGNAYTSGVTNNGTDMGVVVFTVPLDAPDTLYYNCQFHTSMNGTFIIRDIGELGYTGSKGDIGYTGSKGDIGYTGSTGYTGSKGDIGYTGSGGASSINDLSDGYTALGNIGLGSNVLNAYSTTSLENVVIGDNAARNLSMPFGTGSRGCNVVIGHEALCWAVYSGSTVAIGKSVMFNSGSADNTVAIGYRAGYNPNDINPGGGPGQIASVRNVFIGSCSGGSQGSGNNVAVGFCAGSKLCWDGDTLWNVALGSFALGDTTIAYGNTAVGYISLRKNITGIYNTAVGQSSLTNNTTGGCNVAIGWNAGGLATAANCVVAIGACALYANQISGNIGIGFKALAANVSGASNLAIGTNALSALNGSTGNLAIGENALLCATGTANLAIGQNAGCAITSTIYNIAIGQNAMRSAAGGDGVNIAIGPEALHASSTGGYNIAVGWQAGPRYSTGGYTNNVTIGHASGTKLCGNSTNNTFVGHASGSNPFATAYQQVGVISIGSAAGSNASASCNIYIGNSSALYNAGAGILSIGHCALCSNTTGSQNIAIGELALSSNLGASSSIAIGHCAMLSGNNGNSIAIGNCANLNGNTVSGHNIAIGHRALLCKTTGQTNIAIGTNAGQLNTTGSAQVAIGYQAGQNYIGINSYVAIGTNAFCNTGGMVESVGVGTSVGSSMTSGQWNVFVGHQAAISRTGGSDNIFLGYLSGSGSAASGGRNVGVGHRSLNSGTTAACNTAVGWCAGSTTTIGLNNLLLGYCANTTAVDACNQIVIGNAGNNRLIIPGLSLDTNSATTGQGLCWNGTGFVWVNFPAALSLYAENPGTFTAPSATGTNAIAIGNGAKSLADHTVAIGCNACACRNCNVAIGDARSIGTSTVAIGAAYAADSYSVAIGRGACAGAGSSYAYGAGQAKHSSTYAVGVYPCTRNSGQFVYSPGYRGSLGDQQASQHMFRAETIDATPKIMTGSGAGAPASVSSTTVIAMENSMAIAFSGLVLGKQKESEGTNVAAFEIKGLIHKSSTGALTLLNKVINVIDNQPNWSIDVQANATYGGLTIVVTGAAATTIRWNTSILTTEMVYA